MSLEQENSEITYRYKFRFDDGTEKKFIIILDEETLDIKNRKFRRYPEWAKLENFQCPVCSLDKEKNQYCPVLIHLVSIIDQFKDSLSMEMVDVEIATESRTYFKRTSLQEGVKSLIGIFMVTTGCPILSKLKPMVRVHLPFSTLKERKYRVLTMYLLAQYYVKKWGGTPDWDFEKLVDIFNDVRIINKYFCEMLNEKRVKDSTINAIVSLDAFAHYTAFHIIKNMLNVLEDSFKSYLSPYERRHGDRKKHW